MRRILLVFVYVASAAALAVASFAVQPVAASSPPVTHTASHGVFYSGTTSDFSNDSPCTGAGCANGLKITWAAGTCYQGDRYLPVALVWEVKGKVATSEWPLTAPCSTGLYFTWDKYNQLNGAKWLGASSKAAHEGLAICFQHRNQCNAGHCVTAGCLPAHTTGVALFFQGGDTPTGGEWYFKGSAKAPITITGSPNNVFWYGGTPPSSPFASGPGSGPLSPTVTLTGRTSSGRPQVKNDKPPLTGADVHMTWYQPNYESGVSRGCHKVNGVWWSSPPLAFVYTTNGQLSAPITVPGCPVDTFGNPMTYNDIDFSWSTTISGFALTAADPWYFSASNEGCQGKYTGPTKHGPTFRPSDYPSGTIPEPPAGANGLIFGYGHDDFKANCWSKSDESVIMPALQKPGHTRYSWVH